MKNTGSGLQIQRYSDFNLLLQCPKSQRPDRELLLLPCAETGHPAGTVMQRRNIVLWRGLCGKEFRARSCLPLTTGIFELSALEASRCGEAAAWDINCAEVRAPRQG